MDALALALLWLALVVPVAIAAFRRRRDPVAEFSRALESLRPHARGLVPAHQSVPGPLVRAAPVPVVTAAPRPVVPSPWRAKLERRRRIIVVLAALAAVTLVVAALSRARLALGAGMLLVDLGLAYVAAMVANDRRRARA